MKTQDNIMRRHPQFQEFGGNANFGAIVLNPDFAVFDVEVETTAMGTSIAAPACVEQEVVVMFCVTYDLRFNFGLVGLTLCPFGEQLPNPLTILLYSH
jgi:hypothetical protein